MLMPEERTQSRVGPGRYDQHSHVCYGPAANALGPSSRDPWGALLPPPGEGAFRANTHRRPSGRLPKSPAVCPALFRTLGSGSFTKTHVLVRTGFASEWGRENGARTIVSDTPTRSGVGEQSRSEEIKCVGTSCPTPAKPPPQGLQATLAPTLARGTQATPVPSVPPPWERGPARSVRSSDATHPSSGPGQHPPTLSSCPT